MLLFRLAILLLSCHEILAASSEIQLCYFFYGPINDFGFTHRHNIARKYVHQQLEARFPNTTILSHYTEETFGDFFEYVPGFIQRGCQLIFITTSIWGLEVQNFVRQYRNVTFAMLHDPTEAKSKEPNVIFYCFKPFLPWYQAGVVAANQRKNCVAFVASFPKNFFVSQALNGFVHGLQEILGDTETLHVIDIQSWHNPLAERLAVGLADTLLHCDVVAQYADSPTIMEYSKDNSIFSISMNNNAADFYGDSVLTSIILDWDDLYLSLVLQWLEGDIMNLTEGIQNFHNVAELGPISIRLPYNQFSNTSLPDMFCQTANGTRHCYDKCSGDGIPIHNPHPGIKAYSLDLDHCGDGMALSILLDPDTTQLVQSCSYCPDDTYFEPDTLACEACLPGLARRAECVSLVIPVFVIVLSIAVPVSVVLVVVMYFWHVHRTGILRQEVRQEIANFVFHEIRNPMHAVVNMLDVAPPHVQQWEYFTILEDSSNIIQHLLNRALDLLKIQGGEMTLECVPMNLHKTVCIAVEISRATKTTADSDKHLDLVLEPNLPKYIKSDPLRVQQIIVNLTTNALKFCRTQVRVSIEAKPDAILAINVEDDGIGMSPDVQKGLFQAFNQAKANIAREYGGTGLGLSITQKLVALMKGRLSVRSSEDMGSKFHVEVPFTPIGSEVHSSSNQLSAAIDTQTLDFSQKYIVFADDVHINRVVGQNFLKSLSAIKYKLAEDGQILVDLVAEAHQSRQRIHAIFVDLWMPIKDGWEAIAEIRKLESQGNHMKSYIIALSGSNSPADVERAMKVGANTFLSKPATKNQMVAALLPMLDPVVSQNSSRSESINHGLRRPPVNKVEVQSAWMGPGPNTAP